MKMVIGSKYDLVEKEQSLRKIKKSTAEALAKVSMLALFSSL